MHVATKLLVPVFCLGLLLGGCSSSGGASPANGDSSGGSTGAGTAGNDPSGTDGSNSDAGTGISPSEVPGTTAGDTAGGGTGAGTVGTTGGIGDIVGAAPIQELQGEWTTDCLDYAGGFYRSESLSVIGARMLWNFNVYEDQDCSIPVSVGIILNGSSVQQSATTVPTGGVLAVSLGNATEVDFHFDEATVDNKPIPADNFFGKEDFVERVEYDIVLVQDGKLYLGNIDLAGYGGKTPETRPISLDLFGQLSRVP